MFEDEKPIYTYTIQQAEEDGILVNVSSINKDWEKGLFSHITCNLLNKGNLTWEKFSIPNVLDLLNQCLEIVKNKSKNYTKMDWFFSGEIELPGGQKQKVVIVQNELGKYTVMLPNEY